MSSTSGCSCGDSSSDGRRSRRSAVPTFDLTDQLIASAWYSGYQQGRAAEASGGEYSFFFSFHLLPFSFSCSLVPHFTGDVLGRRAAASTSNSPRGESSERTCSPSPSKSLPVWGGFSGGGPPRPASPFRPPPPTSEWWDGEKFVESPKAFVPDDPTARRRRVSRRSLLQAKPVYVGKWRRGVTALE